MFPLLEIGPEPPPLPFSVYVLLLESDPAPGPNGDLVVQSRTKRSHVPGHRGWFQDEHVAKSEPVKPIDFHWEFWEEAYLPFFCWAEFDRKKILGG